MTKSIPFCHFISHVRCALELFSGEEAVLDKSTVLGINCIAIWLFYRNATLAYGLKILMI
jgi:hypothetical protein